MLRSALWVTGPAYRGTPADTTHLWRRAFSPCKILQEVTELHGFLHSGIALGLDRFCRGLPRGTIQGVCIYIYTYICMCYIIC